MVCGRTARCNRYPIFVVLTRCIRMIGLVQRQAACYRGVKMSLKVVESHQILVLTLYT